MNKVILIGRVGQDPKVFEKVCSFSVATDGGKDSEGNKVTDWHNCKAFGKTKDVVVSYVKKGTLVAIEGKLKTESYEDKYYTNVLVDRLSLLGGSSKGKAEPDTREALPFKDDDVPF